MDSVILSKIIYSLQTQPFTLASSIIIFHKIKLNQVFIQAMKKNPFLTKTFFQPYDTPYFDCYDYHQVWIKIFLTQNQNLRHSWFFHSDKLKEFKHQNFVWYNFNLHSKYHKQSSPYRLGRKFSLCSQMSSGESHLAGRSGFRLVRWWDQFGKVVRFARQQSCGVTWFCCEFHFDKVIS